MTLMPLLTILAALCWSPLIAAEPVLRPGDLVAVCGDSITQGGIYSGFIEMYLRVCRPDLGAAVRNCGWSGTGADHFAVHMQDTALPLRPTVATLCYGMNDGRYAAADPATEQGYRASLERIVARFRAAGVRTVVIASPGVVDTRYFKNPKQPTVTAADYNRTLGRLGEVGREVAQATGQPFADLHTAMESAMAGIKQRLGADYPVAGEVDGVHAGPPGHLAMAYAMLKALGCDGDLGTITVDAAAGTASVPAGHRVVSAKPGELVVESVRYPFCFFAGRGDPPQEHVLPFEAHLNGSAAILAALPFNQDLNRFRLVVTGLAAPRARITWGPQSRTYPAAELAAGINLAAEFLDNPFVGPFLDELRAVRAKQGFEVMWLKDHCGDRRPGLLKLLGADSAELTALDQGFAAVHTALDRRCAAAVRPVTHTIRIEALP